MVINAGKIIYTGIRGQVIKCEYDSASYMNLGLPRPQYAVEYCGDTILRTDDLQRAKEAAE